MCKVNRSRKLPKTLNFFSCFCELEHLTEKGPCKICNISAFLSCIYDFFFNQKKTYLTLVLCEIKKSEFFPVILWRQVP